MEWQRHRQAGARVSVLLHPLAVGSLPLLWRDWSRRVHRRACMQFLRQQRVTVEVAPPSSVSLVVTPALLSRAERAHARLTFPERLARNARGSTAGQVTIRLCGVPEDFALALGLATA
jgi:hypothetical protein